MVYHSSVVITIALFLLQLLAMPVKWDIELIIKLRNPQSVLASLLMFLLILHC